MLVQQGLWILVWLCLQPDCTAQTMIPMDKFKHPDICRTVARELEKETHEKFLCVEYGGEA